MKTKQELQQHLDWINENLEPLQEKKKALENAIKALDEPKFDFEKLMPVGSVWLGNESLKVVGSLDRDRMPMFTGFYSAEKAHKEIYYAHQIVKEVQRIDPRYLTGWPYVDLNKALEAAKKAGVLQNLD